MIPHYRKLLDVRGVVNTVVSPTGLELRKRLLDFDSHLDNPDLLDRFFADLGDVIDPWIAAQSLFPVRSRFRAADHLPAFYESYLASPFRLPYGGSRFNNLVWLFVIARSAQPEAVIDSGTFRGGSAWALSQAVPNARIYSFDIDLSRLTERAPNATYLQQDWTRHNWEMLDLSNSLIYFDDHLDQVRRLIEASQRAIPFAIFDDDYSVTSFAGMANRGRALPKIEFVFDEKVRTYKELVWRSSRLGKQTFPIDQAYLDKGRSLIAAAGRVPDLSLVTGINQIPYRLVKIIPS
jgi:hypothetical protein